MTLLFRRLARHTVEGVVPLVGKISYAKFAFMYFLVCIPIFFTVASSILEIRNRRRKVRRCFKCGHIGTMEPYLQNNLPFILSFVLLSAGLIPGLWYLRRIKKKYICGSCGKRAGHIPVSESLAH